MLKGRNKTFAPKKFQRSAPRTEPAPPTPTPTAPSEIQNPEPSQETNTLVVVAEDNPSTIQNDNSEKVLPDAHPPTDQLESDQVPSDQVHSSEKQIEHADLETGINEEPGCDKGNVDADPITLNDSSTPSIPSTALESGNARKKRKKISNEEDQVIVDNSLTSITGGKARKKPGTKRTRKREKTPEGAELETIDPSVVTMQDLCKDLRIGRKSRHHDEIMGRVARLKREAVKAKMRREFPELADSMSIEGDTTPAPREEAPLAPTTTTQNSPPPGPTPGLKMRIVDGQIVTDEQSLRIDLHERARANAVEEEVIEENDFSRVVVSSDYLKRERSQHWNALSNELFWKGLSMFGTDFEMIAKMFPDRSRRQIKLKFNAEERKNPRRLNRVLMGIKTEEIDLDEYQRLGNLELEDLGVIKAEEASIEKEQLEQFQIMEQAKLEDTKRRKAEIHGATALARNLDGYSDDDGVSRNNLPRAKKRKKNMHSAYGGGEEVIVLETIE
ncbi:hypothetical protein K3495_g1612 [Podosphaera aphanis]|nr:hypothetical protein K3495_g1612 [Podosphaera aphanis]